MAVEGGHGEECRTLRRLIILLLARNITHNARPPGFHEKECRFMFAGVWLSIRHQAFLEGLSVFS